MNMEISIQQYQNEEWINRETIIHMVSDETRRKKDEHIRNDVTFGQPPSSRESDMSVSNLPWRPREDIKSARRTEDPKDHHRHSGT